MLHHLPSDTHTITFAHTGPTHRLGQRADTTRVEAPGEYSRLVERHRRGRRGRFRCDERRGAECERRRHRRRRDAAATSDDMNECTTFPLAHTLSVTKSFPSDSRIAEND